MRLFSLLSVLLFVGPSAMLGQRGDRPGDPQTPLPPELRAPSAPPLSAEEALKTFKLAPGFRIEIVAADPLVGDPVAMTIAPDGRIWVAEMRGYMPNVDGSGEDAPNGVIAVLEDTDGDGRMDRRTVFAEGLVLPRAVAIVRDGVLVAEPPRLWFMRDTDGDGKADEKTVIAEDFGNRVNPEQSANGLFRALDNWIYVANHNVRLRWQNGKWQSEPTIFRGQWGITQDDTGRLVYNVNETPLRADAVVPEYYRRNRNLVNPRGGNMDLAKPTDISVWPARLTTGVNRGYKNLRPNGTLPLLTAGCGPTVYRGALFPADFYGNAFICEPAAHLVKRMVVHDRDGALSVTNAYDSTEFLTSTDERFRPVNLYNGPEGGIYLVDLYRGIIQHRLFLTTFLRNQIVERGLESPRAMGRIYRIVPEKAPLKPARLPNLTKASTTELVAALAHENSWWRETAQRLLVDRRDAGAPIALQALAKSGKTPLGRLHALWTLEGLGAIDWPTVQAALRDPDSRIVAAAVRLSEPFLANQGNDAAAPVVIEAALGRELAVKRQLAFSLGAAAPAVATPVLVSLAREFGSAPYFAEAIVSSIPGREVALIEAILSAPAGASSAKSADAGKPVIATATAAALQSNHAATMTALLVKLEPDAKTPPWARAAIFDGIGQFAPRATGTAAATARRALLPAQPTVLQKLAAQSESPDGKRAKELLERVRWPDGKTPVPASQPLTEAQLALVEHGRQAYALCASCHQFDGKGLVNVAPPLAGSAWANASPDAVVRIILNGKKTAALQMPPLHTLDDTTIAAILTHVRRTWGNDAPPIAPDEVKAIRAAVGSRTDAWTDAELTPFTKSNSR